MKRNKVTTHLSNSTLLPQKQRVAFHEAGHAAGMYLNNKAPGLTPVSFKILFKDMADAKAADVMAHQPNPNDFIPRVEGGRLFELVPFSPETRVDESTAPSNAMVQVVNLNIPATKNHRLVYSQHIANSYAHPEQSCKSVDEYFELQGVEALKPKLIGLKENDEVINQNQKDQKKYITSAIAVSQSPIKEFKLNNAEFDLGKNSLGTEKTDQLRYKLQVQHSISELRDDGLSSSYTSLESSRAHFIELYDLAPIGLVTLNEVGMITDVNLKASKLLFEERSLILSRRFDRFIDNDYKDIWHRHFLYTKQNKGPQDCELLFSFEKGVTVNYHLVCQYIADRRSPQMHITISEVIEHKQVEVKLIGLNQAFEAFLEYKNDFVYFIDTDNRFRFCSRSLAKIVGLEKCKDILGKSLYEIFPNKAAQVHSEAELQDLQEGLPLQNHVDSFHDENGKHYWFSTSKWPQLDNDGKVIGYFCVSHDITGLKNSEDAALANLKSIKTETSNVNAALSAFLKLRETENSEAKIILANEIDATALPLLKNLKQASAGRHQTVRLIGILESNLKQLAKSYGQTANLAAIYQKLTPIETQVASMIRQGLATKVIAAALSNSPGTVSIHRKHIRKKLGLGNGINLYSYLLSLTN
jgi:PAS domain S-box-containing protein